MCAYLLIDGWDRRTVEEELAKGVDVWFLEPIKEIVLVKDIPVIMSDEHMALINFYWCYKKMGNPCKEPWPQWPCVIFDLISTLDQVQWGDTFK